MITPPPCTRCGASSVETRNYVGGEVHYCSHCLRLVESRLPPWKRKVLS